MHSAHVSQLCKEIGTELGLSKEEVDVLELAGMYHDIGKISIPDAILNKPDKLTDEEYEIIKTHTQIGYQILRAADEYSGLAEYALSHHERWDGNGYPKGLKGKEIPLFSRIINVADSFEAMTADRPYHKGRSIEDAIIEIIRCSGTQFDPEIANIFMEKVLKHQQ
jgi:diguanylate cyclase